MAPIYQIRLFNQHGTQVAILDDYLRLDYTHRVNGVGAAAVALPGTSGYVGLVEQDGPLEVWRADPVNGINWTREWEGLCISEARQSDAVGLQTYTVYAVSYLDILARAVVAYQAESVGAKKSGTASTCLWEFVDENVGPHATVAPAAAKYAARLADGVRPGFAMGTDPAAGGTWAGSHANDNLLEVCQHIGADAGLDFDVVGNATVAATWNGVSQIVPAYIFWIYDGQRGTDRTVGNVDPATGRNTAGNAPIIFSLVHGNMAVPQYALGRDGSANRVFVLGPGEKTARTVRVVPNGAGIAASPVALREVARNATNQTTTSALDAVGGRVLAEMQPRESFSFQVIQIPACMYGLHYTWGDKVTARYGPVERDKRIVGIRAHVGEGGETISAELADIP